MRSRCAAVLLAAAAAASVALPARAEPAKPGHAAPAPTRTPAAPSPPARAAASSATPARSATPASAATPAPATTHTPAPAPAPAPTPAKHPPTHPAPHHAAKPTPAKKAPGKPQPRAAGPAHAPNDAARRAIVGGPIDTDPKTGAESAELRLIREADRELFPPPPHEGDAPGLPFGALADPAAPVVHASGLPPAVPLAEPPASDGARDLSWLRSLAMPDLPVRWDPRVVRYLEFYRDDPRGQRLTAAWLKRSGRYGAAIRRTLRAQGLPEDLVWTSLVESGFDPSIHSPAGAAGLWQLMPDAAKIYGLVVDRWIDERLDPERSTQAGARYLGDLYRRFGGWELALAAYNMGYGGLLAAIRKFNTNDYWELCRYEAGIPWETTLYVPKIVAIAIVARNLPVFGLESVELDPPVAPDTVTVPGGVTLASVAAAAGVPEADVAAQNPQLRAGRTPPQDPTIDEPQSFTVRVPQGRAATVAANLSRIVSRDGALDRYVVRFGENVEAIAAARHVAKSRLVELNALRPDEVVRAGTVLVVPASASTAVAAPPDAKPVVVVPAAPLHVDGRRRVFYRVIAGDVLADIARALAVAADDVRRWNALDPSARLHEGMTLQAFVPERADLSRVVHLEEADARVLTVGSDEFFTYFEGLRGRKRAVVAVQAGDTWEKLGKRYGLSLGQLERINRRPRSDALAPGETVTVYASSKQAPATGAPNAKGEPATAKDGAEPSPLPPIEAPSPADLPALPEAAAIAGPPKPSTTAP